MPFSILRRLNSINCCAAQYDAEGKILRVHFNSYDKEKRPKVLRYDVHPVEGQLFAELVLSEMPTRFYNDKIKNNPEFTITRVAEEK